MIDFDRDGEYVLFAEDGALLDLVHLRWAWHHAIQFPETSCEYSG